MKSIEKMCYQWIIVMRLHQTHRYEINTRNKQKFSACYARNDNAESINYFDFLLLITRATFWAKKKQNFFDFDPKSRITPDKTGFPEIFRKTISEFIRKYRNKFDCLKKNTFYVALLITNIDFIYFYPSPLAAK